MDKNNENKMYSRFGLEALTIEYAEKLLTKSELNEIESAILQTIIKTLLDK